MSLRLPGAARPSTGRTWRKSPGATWTPRSGSSYNGQPPCLASHGQGGKVTDWVPGAGLPGALQADLRWESSSASSYQPRFVNAPSRFMENLVEAFVFVFVVVLIFTGPATACGGFRCHGQQLSMVFLPLCKWT